MERPWSTVWMTTATTILVLSGLVLTGCLNDQHHHQDISARTPLSERMAQKKDQSQEKSDRSYWQNPDLVINQLGPIRHKVIADIGAGTGYFTFRMLPLAKKVIAIDIDERMTSFISMNATSIDSILQSKLEVRLAKADDPMIRADEVDIVFLSNTYAYLEDRVAYFSHIRPLLREGARIVIVDFKKKRIPIHDDPSERIAAYRVENELISAGYEVHVTDDQSLPYQYIIVASPKK